MSRTADRDARLEQAYRAMGALRDGGEACPEATRLWSAVHGELEPDEALDVLDHASTCPACIAAMRLARELGGAETHERAAPARRSNRFLRYTLAAAAMLVLGLLTLPIVRNVTVERDRSTVRAGTRPQIVSEVDGAAPLPRDDCVLRWSGTGEASSYRVDVTTEGLDVVFSVRGLSEPRVRIPAEKLEAVPPGGRILWRVEAILPDGSRATSVTFSNAVH